MHLEMTQRIVLSRLLHNGCATSYGTFVGLKSSMEYEAFRSDVPLVQYNNLIPWVERCKAMESDVLWPGVVRRFAVSAGTTGNGKHIPITDERLSSDIGFMRSVVRHVVRSNPDPGLFMGWHVALSGSVEFIDGIEYGEISGMLACATPRWLRNWHGICPEKAAHMPWTQRLEALVEWAQSKDVRVLTGVPTWLLVFLRDVSRRRQLPIEQVWPNLRLIITGGVALSGYIEALRVELGSIPVRFLENYGASEGYHAFDWYDAGSMLLQCNSDNFYELFEINKEVLKDTDLQKLNTSIIPLWHAQPDIDYGLVISNNSGLWRYVTNDIIRFDSVHPPRLKVVGRLNEMTDTFGEAVTKEDILNVIGRVLPENTFRNVHVRPTWDNDTGLPMHEWIFEISDDRNHELLTTQDGRLAEITDALLQSMNRHYSIRRQTGAMAAPQMRIITRDGYEQLIRSLPKSQSKLGMFI